MEQNLEDARLIDLRYDFVENILHVKYLTKCGTEIIVTIPDPSESLSKMCHNTMRVAISEAQDNTLKSIKNVQSEFANIHQQ